VSASTSRHREGSPSVSVSLPSTLIHWSALMGGVLPHLIGHWV
jgi:hypothetical protein